MGDDRKTTEQTQSQQVTNTPEENELNKMQLERARGAQEGLMNLDQAGIDQILGLIKGGELPGSLGAASRGISPEAIGEQATRMVGKNMTQFQKLGISDSGTEFVETAKDIAGNLLFPSEQYNIGASQNLLNLIMGGQAQVQAPIQASSGQLGSSLAGLRGISQTGSSTETSMNPFMRSFQTAAGGALGNPFLSFGQAGAGAKGFAAMSSIKYKEDIVETTIDGVEILKETELYDFTYKPEMGDGKRRVGILAEEAPLILTTDGRDKFDMYNAIGVLMDANKKLIDRVEVLEERLGE